MLGNNAKRARRRTTQDLVTLAKHRVTLPQARSTYYLRLLEWSVLLKIVIGDDATPCLASR